MIRRILALAFCTFICFDASNAASGTSEIIETSLGSVQGTVADGVASFRGIPYAAPPVGALRWRPPQPAAPWQGVRDATVFGDSCMQTRVPFTPAPGNLSEDCLTLNVWKPAGTSAAKLPVMVWIYGGGFYNGASAAALYDGTAFARHDVILVSMNYRLGRFGFFAHPALTKEHPDEPLGNYGFMDQIAALQWVQHNIAAFGGDPQNVTVFGESAGARSVDALLIARPARGLFQKAIIESSTQRQAPAIPLHDRDHGATRSGESIGVAFARSVGVETDDPAALRAIPADKVVGGLAMGIIQPGTFAGPMIEDSILTEQYEQAFADGHIAKVPLIIGANDYEAKVFAAALDLKGLVERLGPSKDTIFAAYKTGVVDDTDRDMRFMTEMMYAEPTRFLARQAAKSAPTYLYRFSYVAEGLRGKVQGALHASELAYVFDNLQAAPETSMNKGWFDALYAGAGFTPTKQDHAIAKAMNGYWIAFAKTGNPNGEGRPRWTAVSEDPNALMIFGPGGPHGGADPLKERLDQFEQMNVPGWR